MQKATLSRMDSLVNKFLKEMKKLPTTRLTDCYVNVPELEATIYVDQLGERFTLMVAYNDEEEITFDVLPLTDKIQVIYELPRLYDRALSLVPQLQQNLENANQMLSGFLERISDANA